MEYICYYILLCSNMPKFVLAEQPNIRYEIPSERRKFDRIKYLPIILNLITIISLHIHEKCMFYK